MVKPPAVGLVSDEAINRLAALGPDRIPSIFRVGEPEPRGRYRHWDDLRHLTPPDGVTPEEWWIGVRIARMQLMRPLGLGDAAGKPFRYAMTDSLLRALHHLDQQASGRLEMPQQVTDPATRDRYIVRSLIEEAIASSQLEGASTTRLEAKEMIRFRRKPRDRAERMILNNYRAIQRIQEVVGEPLTADLIRELHAVVTEDTLQNPDASGRFQLPSEERIRVFDAQGRLQHDPPPAEDLPGLIERLCSFANETDGAPFLHPIVRAIALHFLVAWMHPFEDGNGRTARAVFYWSALSQGYWLLEFLSISRILLRAPAQYERAFAYSESDENDLTYFILYQLKVVERALAELYEYLERKATEVEQLSRILRRTVVLNHRQQAVITHALKHPDATYTFQSHASSHSVVRQTARADLIGLEGLGLLTRTIIRRAMQFRPVADLEERLRQIAGGSAS